MTRLERDLQGMLNTLKIGGDSRWRQGKQKNPRRVTVPVGQEVTPPILYFFYYTTVTHWTLGVGDLRCFDSAAPSIPYRATGAY